MSFFPVPASAPQIQHLVQLNPSQLNLSISPKTQNHRCNHPVNLARPRNAAGPLIACCSNSDSSSSPSSSTATTTTSVASPPAVKKHRKRFRIGYPGEKKGITEEMRFVAMRLRNIKGKYTHKNAKSQGDSDDSQDSESDSVSEKDEEEVDGDEKTWEPSMEGFVQYLVDSKLVFDTVERIVDKSDDVSYAYFRRTGLERSKSLAKDLEWFRKKGVVIPEPSSFGVSYTKHLEELSEKQAFLFLCHFYNIYFSHIAGGQVISGQVSEKLLGGRVLDFNRWDGDARVLLMGLREKLNMVGKHWTRREKDKCLSETKRSFRYLGDIVRLIIS